MFLRNRGEGKKFQSQDKRRLARLRKTARAPMAGASVRTPLTTEVRTARALGRRRQPKRKLRVGGRRRWTPLRRRHFGCPLFPRKGGRPRPSEPKIIGTRKPRRRFRKRDDVLTFISAKPNLRDAESHPANDNHLSALADTPILQFVNDDDDVADIARRAERLGNAVVIVMALCLIVAPAIYLALTYGI